MKSVISAGPTGVAAKAVAKASANPGQNKTAFVQPGAAMRQ